MLLLSQFLLRLSFGLALAMALTSHRQVTSGYFRNHLYVLLGANVLASLAAIWHPSELALWPPLVAAVLSYLGSVAWLYEKPQPGRLLLAAISIVCLIGARLGAPLSAVDGIAAVLQLLDPPTGGLVLGSTLAAMFLGHWYLNTPTMELRPLEKLMGLMALSLVARAAVCGIGLALEVQSSSINPVFWFVALRWLAGIVGALGLTVMAWQTLKVPNTQSATGILYVCVIVTFLGELCSLLLSQNAAYPV